MNIIEQDRSQTLMFSSIDDIIPSKHPVRVISYLIETILCQHRDKYAIRGTASTGRPAYSVETLLKIYIYGYMNRITSSRRLEQETYRNVELIWLTGNLRPDHKTISDFRKDNKFLIQQFSKDVKLFLKEMGLIGKSLIAVDGTKVKANASRDMLSERKILELLKSAEEELERYLGQLDEQDHIESQTDEIESSNKYLSLILAKEQEISRLKAQLEEFKQIGKNHISRTDPDSTLMKSRDGLIPGYNVQLGSDSENKFIVYEAVTEDANDIDQLKAVPDTLGNELEIIPEKIVADTGYCNLDMIEKIEEETGIECFISHPKDQNISPKITFTYDETNDMYVCSEGQPLTLEHRNKKSKKSYVNVYLGRNCQSCRLKQECTRSKKGRHISRPWNHEYRQRHKEKTESDHGKQISRLRKSTIEHIFGTMKTWLGKIPILTRGVDKVISEIKLFTSSYNIKHLLNLFSFDKLMSIINAYTKQNAHKKAINLFIRMNIALIGYRV